MVWLSQNQFSFSEVNVTGFALTGGSVLNTHTPTRPPLPSPHDSGGSDSYNRCDKSWGFIPPGRSRLPRWGAPGRVRPRQLPRNGRPGPWPRPSPCWARGAVPWDPPPAAWLAYARWSPFRVSPSFYLRSASSLPSLGFWRHIRAPSFPVSVVTHCALHKKTTGHENRGLFQAEALSLNRKLAEDDCEALYSVNIIPLLPQRERLAGSVVFVLGGVLRWTMLLATFCKIQKRPWSHSAEDGHKCEHLFVGRMVPVVFTSGSCHKNGPLPTLGKTSIKRASFHKLEMRTREAIVY